MSHMDFDPLSPADEIARATVLSRWPLIRRGALGNYLMELYELNYRLLRLLCGGLRGMPPRWSSSVAGVTLILSSYPLGPYTADLSFAFSLPEVCFVTAARLYHDASLCEVIVGPRLVKSPDDLPSSPRAADPQEGTTLETKWHANHLFNRWIDYALGHGYFARRRIHSVMPRQGESGGA